MSDRAGGGGSPFSTPLVAVLLAVSMLAFGAVVTLSAWSPELADRDRAGPHPYSTSALGYNGLVRLLEARGDLVRISRVERTLEDSQDGLKIVTLAAYGMDQAVDEMDITGPALVVLPKWTGSPEPLRPNWQRETRLLDAITVERMTSYFDSDARIWRLRSPARVETPFGSYDLALGDDMQVLRADSLVSVIPTAAGDLVAQIPGEDIYLLSDPDLLNTFGLAEAENARLALALVDWLRPYEGAPVILDATLHGFERSENLLRMALDVPFLGATLTALMVFLMIGWAGAVRYGDPDREARAIALGKDALMDNTAGLIAMGRRETRLAPDYLALTRRAVAKAIGAPRTFTAAELTELFDRMSEAGEETSKFSDLEVRARAIQPSREALMTLARQLYRWRKETTHGHQ